MAAFGRYELLRRVGSGGMADIWKARVEGPGGFHKSLAIKRILPDLVENREFLRMFADEAKLVASLSHPNIVQVLDFGHEGTHDYYIAMEYVAGVNLARLLNRAFDPALVGPSASRRPPPSSLGSASLLDTSRLPPELALTVVVEAVRGLGHAHTRTTPAGVPLGIVHRDVSPQNILLSFSGEVKLTDFGIARVATAIPRTAVGHVRGKVAYMSPEQAAADPERPVDVRSDLFSLGIILYEMITGRRLFPGGASPENHARVIRFAGPSEEELAPVPPALRGIVSTALQGDPAARFQSAQALEAELTNALGDDVLAVGRQFISSLLPRLFPDEYRSEREEDAALVSKTNAQVSLADVDAIDFRRRRRPMETRVSSDGGVIPEPVTGGDTVISPREPSMTREPSVSVSVTVNPQDPEETRLPAEEYEHEDAAIDEHASRLTLAPPVPAPPERSTRTGFEEPLYPPRPPPPKWLAPALVVGGAALGIPVAVLLVNLVFSAVGENAPQPTPPPTPFAMRSNPLPSPAPAELEPEPEPELELEQEPEPGEELEAEPQPEEPERVLAGTPTRVATPARTPRPFVAARTPVPTPTPQSESIFDPAPAVVAMGRLRVDGSKPCDVFVDRSKVAAPMPLEREVSAGKHTIGFVHKPTGLWLEQTYEIPAGGSLELFVDVDGATVRVR